MAECELLSADIMGSENRLSMLAQRAKSGHDIAVVTRLRFTLYTTLDRSDRGVEVFLEYLRRGDIGGVASAVPAPRRYRKGASIGT
jgi:hypothetical protein